MAGCCCLQKVTSIPFGIRSYRIVSQASFSLLAGRPDGSPTSSTVNLTLLRSSDISSELSCHFYKRPTSGSYFCPQTFRRNLPADMSDAISNSGVPEWLTLLHWLETTPRSLGDSLFKVKQVRCTFLKKEKQRLRKRGYSSLLRDTSKSLNETKTFMSYKIGLMNDLKVQLRPQASPFPRA